MMQKYKVFKDMEEQILPEKFTAKYPKLSKLVLKMVDKIPARRP